MVPHASSPNLSLAASKSMARQASLSALVGSNGGASPSNRMGADGQPIAVGDGVDVPGGMYGVVHFVGAIRGKAGIFAGVELSREHAARGKNNGEVDGIHYFHTTVPGAGIFLPVHRAQKRRSAASSDGQPTTPTPSTPARSPFAQTARTPASFSQSVGPARNGGIPPTAFSKSAIGAPPRFASPAPPRLASPAPRFASPAPLRAPPALQKPRTPGPRPYSRNTNSRLGQHDTIDEDGEGAAGHKPRRPGSRVGAHHADEVQRLQALLDERDRQLTEQASSLAEMETSLSEIQHLLPDESLDLAPALRSNAAEPSDVTTLRTLLREKNDKIAMLTAEFDAHRSDFRSTIDTLELASTETERVYEKKVEALQEELREYQSRSEDVETVAMQLKQLEDLVQELEEGLEDARRGEAEARGEVEFLRGEVERGRLELRREREKAATASKGAGSLTEGSHGLREMEQRDDEIRGLKAIIHSLSSGGTEESLPAALGRQASSVDFNTLESAQAQTERLEREKEELRRLVERKAYREEELERELEKLQRQLGLVEQRESVISNGASERTATQEKRSSGRDSKGTVVEGKESNRREAPPALAPMTESDGRSSANGSLLWCEICETGGHDILNCSAMGASPLVDAFPGTHHSRYAKDMVVVEGLRRTATPDPALRPFALSASLAPGSAPSAPLPTPAMHASSPSASPLVPPKGGAAADPDKWCALCESEGHDVTACPNEDAF